MEKKGIIDRNIPSPVVNKLVCHDNLQVRFFRIEEDYTNIFLSKVENCHYYEHCQAFEWNQEASAYREWNDFEI